MSEDTRRDFLKKTGAFLSTAAAASIPIQSVQASMKSKSFKIGFRPAEMKNDDQVNISRDYKYNIVSKSGDSISKTDVMGENIDFLAYLPGENDDHGFIWANNEAFHSNIVWGKKITSSQKTKSQVEAEKKLVGGAYTEVKRSNGVWTLIKDSQKSFKITASDPIPMAGPCSKRMIEGTLGNCGGGLTPWKTILTCEENYQNFYFKKNLDDGMGWNKYFEKNELDYGWVCEVDVEKKSARKLSSLGRFAHEGATVYAEKNRPVVVYMGEDRKGGALFKFVSEDKYTGDDKKDEDLLLRGSLFAANLKKGRWEKLSPHHPKIASDPAFKNIYKTEALCLENASKVAKIIGATPLNRAEDIEIDPNSGDVLIALTNNSDAGDFYGQILKITEDGDHSTALSFTHNPYMTGGPNSGFSCPDNLCFGPDGSLYIATDVSGKDLGQGAMKTFKKNGLFKVEIDKGGNPIAVPILYAPFEAEVTGPVFSSDATTLFVSIQHPGELSFKTKKGYTSHWPSGKGRPRSAIIAITKA